ncbi:MAG: hypothetical protein ABI265_09815 [Gallionella sp.]
MQNTGRVIILMLLAGLASCGGSGIGGYSALAPVSNSACGSATFASAIYSTGSINGQDGWFVDPAALFDEGVVNLGPGACRGKGVWKIDNTVISGGFGNQPQSPVFVESAGESSVRSAGGGDTMTVSFFIKTISSGADGSSFTHSFSPTVADRQTYVRFDNTLDANGGFQIYSIDGLLLDQTHTLATHLSRNVWHKIKIVDINVDGLSAGGIANDVVNVFIDGNFAGTFSTWESWRAAIPSATLAVTRSLFRLNISAAADDPSFTSPQGFYIDDYVQEITNSSAPTTIIESYKTGFEVP